MPELWTDATGAVPPHLLHNFALKGCHADLSQLLQLGTVESLRTQESQAVAREAAKLEAARHARAAEELAIAEVLIPYYL